MGNVALSLTFSLCFLPSIWLFTAAIPMFETSKSTPRIVQRARSFFPGTGDSQDLNRSSESHSIEKLHFPISSKMKVIRETQRKYQSSAQRRKSTILSEAPCLISFGACNDELLDVRDPVQVFTFLRISRTAVLQKGEEELPVLCCAVL